VVADWEFGTKDCQFCEAEEWDEILNAVQNSQSALELVLHVKRSPPRFRLESWFSGDRILALVIPSCEEKGSLEKYRERST
jgi:hypothetical protein